MPIIILLVVFVIIAAPVALIWSLNTLFGLNIPFTVETWIATMIVGGVLRGVDRR